jgi:hypothetical protein
MYIDTNHDAICFIISLLIIDVIIKELFYRDNNQIITNVDEFNNKVKEDHHMNMERIHNKAEKNIPLKRNAMKLFKLDEDNKMYMVNVPNNTRFFMVIDYVKCGMSFHRCHDPSHQGPP